VSIPFILTDLVEEFLSSWFRSFAIIFLGFFDIWSCQRRTLLVECAIS
jgi:hypothetical protein